METKPIVRNKKRKKIQFNITLSEEQKLAKSTMLSSICTILDGKPGVSKSTLAMNVALDLLFNKDIAKIYCTRPPIELSQFSNFGALPGSTQDKNDAYMTPFLESIKSNYSGTSAKDKKITSCIDKEEIEFLPLPYIRGKNLGTKSEPCVVIVDEGQSCDTDTMYAILTRLGESSKMIITMDLDQADNKGKSGGIRLLEIVDMVEGLSLVKLKTNYRSKFVQNINEHWWKPINKNKL